MALSCRFKERSGSGCKNLTNCVWERREGSEEEILSEFHFLMGWENLGTVDTIYEEDDYGFSSSSPSLSPSDLFSSPPTPLHTRVEQWSRGSGIKPDVIIRVQGKCFHLHKDALSSKSNYLKRHLMAASTEFTLSPPLNLTAETFALVAGFCYGAHILLTPFNIAALRTAAELLEMKEGDGDGDGKNSFAHLTEYYFLGVIGVNREYTLVVFRSCLELLPAAEKTAFMVSRCVEAYWSGKDKEEGDISCFEDVKSVEMEGFLVVAESMSRRFDSHDMLYRLINLYFTGNGGKVTEEEKTQICSFIDCSKLSPASLLEAVQNPIMPLRFIVQALLVEQLNTRLSLRSTRGNGPPQRRNSSCKDLTLGAILHRDATQREEAKMKATVDATSSRIRSLEKELSGMKKLLTESDCRQRSIMESARSASFHYGTENKISRGERGSISSSMFRSGTGESDRRAGEESSFLNGRRRGPSDGTQKQAKSMAKRVMNGIKSAFRGSNSGPKRSTETKSKSSSFKWDGNGVEDGGEDSDTAVVTGEKKVHQSRAEATPM